MRYLLFLLLLAPVLRAAIYRVAFAGHIESVHLSAAYSEELTAGSTVAGSLLIDSGATDLQPTLPYYGGYRIVQGEVVIGTRRFSNRSGSCLLFDDLTFSGLLQDRAAIGANLGAYGPQRDGALVIRFDELPLDALSSDALSPALDKLSRLPGARLEIHNSYNSSFQPYARGSLTVLKVDIVPDSTLSLMAIDADRRIISRYRSTPGSSQILQRSLDLVEWSDIAPIPEGSATFQWVDTGERNRVFYRIK